MIRDLFFQETEVREQEREQVGITQYGKLNFTPVEISSIFAASANVQNRSSSEGGLACCSMQPAVAVRARTAQKKAWPGAPAY